MSKKPVAIITGTSAGSALGVAEAVMRFSELRDMVSVRDDIILDITVPVKPRDEILMVPPDELLQPEVDCGGPTARNARRLNRKPKRKKKLF